MTGKASEVPPAAQAAPIPCLGRGRSSPRGPLSLEVREVLSLGPGYFLEKPRKALGHGRLDTWAQVPCAGGGFLLPISGPQTIPGYKVRGPDLSPGGQGGGGLFLDTLSLSQVNNFVCNPTWNLGSGLRKFHP